MSRSSEVFRVGTRSSKLALLQTRSVIAEFARRLPGVRFEEAAVSSPGDRDLVTDLRTSPPDFFTRDLDDLLLDGAVDLAVHSAKDVPDPVRAGLDWCWLPWREDARDALLRPAGKTMADLPAAARIGVSSDRREAYCGRRFPGARLLPIRGNIQERLQQLDGGAFDLVIMAGAALIRLGLDERVTEWIPLADLPAPDGQGYLAITFRAGDARLLALRRMLVQAVTFAAAGVGTAGNCTLDGLAAIRRADVCLHDTLMGHDLMEHVPATVTCVDVGKRCGQHTLPQTEITQLIATYARRGQRVVRLKGGDPGIFGRLAEEVELLDALQLPYRVLPGVSSLMAATTGTGMLLTRRGVSRGFCVMTPRKEGGALGEVDAATRAKLPMVFFMAISSAGEVARQLLGDGFAPATPVAAVFNGGSDQAWVLTADLATIEARIKATATEQPGLLVVGEIVKHRYGRWGALAGRRVLLTASQALQEKAAGLVADYGGVPVCRPLIRLAPTPEAGAKVRRVGDYDWVVLTSPSAVRCFGDLLRETGTDHRAVQILVTCGGGTSEELAKLGFRADIQPPGHFSAAGLLETAGPLVTPRLRVLRLRSDKAGDDVAEALRARGALVDDCLLYRNEPVRYPERPEFDMVFFASASAVEAYDEQWGAATLAGRFVAAIGQPTLAALLRAGVTADLVGPEATVEACLTAMAEGAAREAVMKAIGEVAR